MMLSGLEQAEREIGQMFGGRGVVLTGRGTSAITLALRSLEEKGEVLVPALVCPDVLYGVIYSGFAPRLVDVSSSDFDINPRSLEEKMTSRTRAIIAVHLFGHQCDLKSLYEVAQRRSVRVIEDSAQSVGGKYEGKLLGSFGDVTVLSFGGQKILDGGGGGAVISDDSSLLKRVREIQAGFPGRPSPATEILMRAVYLAVYSVAQRTRPISARASTALLGAMPSMLKKAYLIGPKNLDTRRIQDSLSRLNAEKELRVRNAMTYRALLTHPQVTHPPVVQDPNYYKYSVLVGNPRLRDKLVSELKARGFKASSLYWPIDAFLGPPDHTGLPNSHYVGSRIVNFPVEPRITTKEVKACATAALEILG